MKIDTPLFALVGICFSTLGGALWGIAGRPSMDIVGCLSIGTVAIIGAVHSAYEHGRQKT